MIQTITKLFGSGQNTSAETAYSKAEASSAHSNHAISREQFCYTVWKKLKLNISTADIEAFYNKHDAQNSGYITMFDFCNVIIKKHNVNEPLMEDRVLIDKVQKMKLMTTL